MEAKLQRRIQRYGWDAAEKIYEQSWIKALKPSHKTLLELANIQSGHRVFEAACGTGIVTRKIAKAVLPEGHVHATNISQKMIDNVTSLQLLAVEARRMDGEDLSDVETTFDQAVCALGLMYMPDPRAALAEMCRILKPSGRATATVWGQRKNCGWADIFPIVDRQVKSQVCPMFFAPGNPNALMHDFELAGFTDLKEIRQAETLKFSDASSLTEAMMLGGPVALAATRFSSEQMKVVEEEFLQSVADFQTSDGGYEIPGEFVSVTGIKAG